MLERAAASSRCGTTIGTAASRTAACRRTSARPAPTSRSPGSSAGTASERASSRSSAPTYGCSSRDCRQMQPLRVVLELRFRHVAQIAIARVHELEQVFLAAAQAEHRVLGRPAARSARRTRSRAARRSARRRRPRARRDPRASRRASRPSSGTCGEPLAHGVRHVVLDEQAVVAAVAWVDELPCRASRRRPGAARGRSRASAHACTAQSSR